MPELLEVRGLVKHFPIRRGFFGRVTGQVRAVDGVDLTVPAGGTVALVGESGSGKTTLGRAILRLVEPTSGSVTFDGRDVLRLDARALRAARRDMQIIFQDPYSSLNPRMKVATIVGEPFAIHRLARGAQRRERVAELLRTVGLDPSAMTKYPHEFSGGQRQRIGIARALALRPRFIVADEPVSALDVSIQAQVLNLMVELQEKLSLAYLFIAHDLRIVEHISDRVAVMYLGRIVESAPTRALFSSPRHPYTQALLAAIPVVDPETRRRRVIVPGDVPSPAAPPPGCRFHTRCPVVIGLCRTVEPPLVDIGGGHLAACHLASPGPPPEALPKERNSVPV
ncbi:MAG TPA: dipeptide ABC transporter ATP-binding protein [Candidatus Polarisedimenticolia bacterium]|nr:dipeptide ABC transporter ATP-binding protein [Candidatus Polarisedimenticolia bacterium]